MKDTAAGLAALLSQAMPGPFRLAVLWGRTRWVEIQAPFPGNPRGKQCTGRGGEAVSWGYPVSQAPCCASLAVAVSTEMKMRAVFVLAAGITPGLGLQQGCHAGQTPEKFGGCNLSTSNGG